MVAEPLKEGKRALVRFLLQLGVVEEGLLVWLYTIMCVQDVPAVSEASSFLDKLGCEEGKW